MNTKLQDCVFIKRLSRQSTHSDTSRAPAHSCCREFANTRHAMSSLAMCAYHASGIVAAKRASAGAASSSQRWRDPGGAISSPPPARPGGPARASVPRRDAAEPTPNLDETPSCFACPVCSGAMIRRSSGGKTLACGLGHSFDVAKDGHVNLMGRGARATGDTAEMLAARRRFLNAGHYADASDVASAFITRALERAVREAAADADASSPSPSPSSAANRPDVELTPRRRRIAANKRRSRAARPAPSPPRPRPLIVDFGCGEGWWLSRVAAAAAAATVETRLAATDASPAAARLAARLLPDGSEIAVADAQSDAQPFADGSVAAALSAFAPRNPREMRRVLAAGGAAVVVSPGDDHLRELRERKDVVGVLDVAGGKRERVVEAFESAGFVSDGEEAVAGEMLLDLNNLRDLVGMGPSAFHRTEESAAALDAFFEEHASAVGEDGTRKVRVTRSFVVQCFRKPEE